MASEADVVQLEPVETTYSMQEVMGEQEEEGGGEIVEVLEVAQEKEEEAAAEGEEADEEEEEEEDEEGQGEASLVADLLSTSNSPGYTLPNQLEQTLAIIKPDAIRKAEEIIKIIQREGFLVLQSRRVKLSQEQATSFFQDSYGADWFEGNVQNLSSGPLIAIVITGPNAVRHWAELVGPASWEERSSCPTSLTFRYGTEGDNYKNGVHAPATYADALRELHFFFPELIVEPTIATNLASHYLNQNVHPVLTVGLSKLVRERPDDPVLWLADWLLANNPNKPREQGPNLVHRSGKCK